MGKPGKSVLTAESGTEKGARASDTGTVRPVQPPATRAERWSVRRLLDVIGQPSVTLVLWDGSEFPPQRATSVADIIIRDRRALRRLLVNPEYEFGEIVLQRTDRGRGWPVRLPGSDLPGSQGR